MRIKEATIEALTKYLLEKTTFHSKAYMVWGLKTQCLGREVGYRSVCDFLLPVLGMFIVIVISSS